MAETKDLVTADDLLAKMRQGVKEVYDVRCRGLVIPMRILALDEEIDIRSRMIAQNTRSGGDQVSLAALVQKETLKTASYIASGNTSALPDRFFEKIHRDELSFIYNEYIKVVEQVNPSLEVIQADHWRALVDAIKKNSVSASDLSLPQLRAVFVAFQDLIQQLDTASLPQDNSLGGQS